MFNHRIHTVLWSLLALSACQSIPLGNSAYSDANQAQDASMIAPMIEKREAIVATGYAVICMQNHKNQAQ